MYITGTIYSIFDIFHYEITLMQVSVNCPSLVRGKWNDRYHDKIVAQNK